MKKFGFATIIASGLAAAIVGFAAPAQADATDLPVLDTISAGVDHVGWINDIQPDVNVPKVDTAVHHSGR